MLIVPFVFSRQQTPELFQPIAEIYIHFAAKHHFPIICDEMFFRDPQTFENLSGIQQDGEIYGFEVSNFETRMATDHMLITAEEKTRLFEKIVPPKVFDNRFEDTILYLLGRRDHAFEQLIDSKLDAIESTRGSIDALLTWVWWPSLQHCADQRGIKLIVQEFSVARGKTPYGETLGFFTFGNRYQSHKVRSDFINFQKHVSSLPIFDRRELLALLLDTSSLSLIGQLDDCAYSFGIDVAMDDDRFWYNLYDGRNVDDYWKKVDKLVFPNDVLARYRPYKSHSKQTLESHDYAIDISASSLEWILKCQRSVSTLSNIAYESMLAGRTAYVLNRHTPFYYNNVPSLHRIENAPVSVEYLNYFTFGYLVPWELMLDPEYILWRCNMPPISDIYLRNVKTFLNKSHLTQILSPELPHLARLKLIASLKHGISQDELQQCLRQTPNRTRAELLEEVNIASVVNALVVETVDNRISPPLHPRHVWSGIIPKNTMLSHDDLLVSPNFSSFSQITKDGNLIAVTRGLLVAESGTVGVNCHLAFQGDGNLVIYQDDEARFSSNTAGAGESLVLSDDGTLQILDATNRPIWALTQPPEAPTAPHLMALGSEFRKGYSLRSPNGRHEICFTIDGVLVRRFDGHVTHVSDAHGVHTKLVFQHDGNLVLYERDTPVWDSGTAAKGAQIRLTDEGRLEITDVVSRTIWTLDEDPNFHRLFIPVHSVDTPS